MKVLTNEAIYEEENTDIIHLWEPLEINIDEKYEYVPKDKLFLLFSNLLYYVVAFPILNILTKIIYNLKIEGKENIKSLKDGAVTISNHVLFLDCAMVGLACGLKKVYYTTREESFKIPFVRKLIKLLKAIPIPNSIENKKHFVKEINKLLINGDIVHFYPEVALWPYCEKIRNFKTGAFKFAINNKVPIVPMVFKFVEPQGFRKIFKRKKDVKLIILKPIMCDEKSNLEMIKQEIYNMMKDI